MAVLRWFFGVLLPFCFACPTMCRSCPSLCLCPSDSTIRCTSQSRTRVPGDVAADVKLLDLSRNLLQTVDPVSVQHLTNLLEVRLAHNKLSEIPNFGEATSNITVLSLHHNSISEVHPVQLLLYTSLRTLDLGANQLSNISPDSFPSAVPLHTLVLSGNAIHALHAGCLDSLSTSLRVLRLALNGLTSLPKKTFNLGQLQELDLSRNDLHRLEGLTFFHLEALKVLHLQRNSIVELDDDAFLGLRTIRSLNLQHNVIPAVSTGWVYGLESLQQLSLSHNNLTRIDGNAWSFCPNLLDLDLAWNNLPHLEKGSFSGLPALQLLGLAHNSIGHVTSGAFHGLDALQSLDMSRNQLHSADTLALRQLRSLKEVRLAHNKLTEIPNFGEAAPNITLLSLHRNRIRTLHAEHLARCSSLLTLDLSANHLTGKRLHNFSSTIPLHTLVLSGNRIRVLHAGSLDSLSSSLRVLHLARNRLTSLPKKAFNLEQLQELDLSHNRLRWVEGLTFHLEALETLHLQHNFITDLMDGSFWGLHAIRSLNLQHNLIPAVSTGWVYGLRSLRQLYLSRNNITRIDANAWSFCPHLFELDLAWNGLDHLDKESFSGLPALRRLSLEHNSIGHVAEGAFHGLDALRSLNISHNEISWSVEDTNGAFSGFGRLTTLGLQGNKIKLITKNAFSQLESLEELDLEDNPIISIQADALMSLKALKHLRLNSSNLLCDCQLQWLTPWLAQQGVGQSVHIICGHPTWLRGHPVYLVSPEHFVCENLTKPRIVVQPETHSALRGSDVSFMCSALTPLDSTLTFLWRKDNLPLSSSEGEVHTQDRKHPEAGASHDEVTSELRLPAVDFAHEGRYQCLASNALGTAYSDKARLTVSVFPTFTKMPRDQSLRVGMTARLECAAAGHPAPQVAWQKDGGTDFPAARERRMHVMPTDDVFFIVGLKPADAGVYTCTAQNAAGSITANATLAVLETPWFVRPLRDRTVVVGETAVLHCIAAGSPPPRLTWSRRNEPLTLTERHFFAADNQLLVIVNASPEDSGSYTCELSNTLGTERGRLHLSVVRSPDCQVHPEPQVTGVAASSSDQATTVGVVVIVVVCCVVGTSVVWVIIIYHTRRRGEAYSVSNTDDTLVPPDVPSYLSSQGTLAERPEGSGRSESGSSNQLTSSPGVRPPVLEDPGVGVPPEVAPLCAECCQRSVGGGESMSDEVSSKLSSVIGSCSEFAMTTHAGHVTTPYPSNHDRPHGGKEHSLLGGLQSQSQV